MKFTNSTTDLTILRTAPHRYTWGKVIKVHDVGSYSIVEYEPDGFAIYGTSIGHQARMFAIYVNGEHLAYSSKTFDGALVVVIAAARGGRENNSQYLLNMADAAMKVLGVPLD